MLQQGMRVSTSPQRPVHEDPTPTVRVVDGIVGAMALAIIALSPFLTTMAATIEGFFLGIFRLLATVIFAIVACEQGVDALPPHDRGVVVGGEPHPRRRRRNGSCANLVEVFSVAYIILIIKTLCDRVRRWLRRSDG
jgi:hypothetical protein